MSLNSSVGSAALRWPCSMAKPCCNILHLHLYRRNAVVLSQRVFVRKSRRGRSKNKSSRSRSVQASSLKVNGYTCGIDCGNRSLADNGIHRCENPQVATTMIDNDQLKSVPAFTTVRGRAAGPHQLPNCPGLNDQRRHGALTNS